MVWGTVFSLCVFGWALDVIFYLLVCTSTCSFEREQRMELNKLLNVLNNFSILVVSRANPKSYNELAEATVRIQFVCKCFLLCCHSYCIQQSYQNKIGFSSHYLSHMCFHVVLRFDAHSYLFFSLPAFSLNKNLDFFLPWFPNHTSYPGTIQPVNVSIPYQSYFVTKSVAPWIVQTYTHTH